MASIKDLLKNQVVTGVLVGLGSAFIIPKVLPILGTGLRPVLKSALKSAIVLTDKGKEIAVELMEAAEDLWVEVKAELDEEHKISSMNLNTGDKSETT